MKISVDFSTWRGVWIWLLIFLCLGVPHQNTTFAQQRLPTDIGPLTPTGQTGGIVFATAAQGNHTFIGLGPRVEIRESSAPDSALVGRSPILPGVVRSITPAGDRLYVALGEEGVQILDISDPANPVVAGGFTTNGQVTDVAVDGNYAYVTSIFDSFRIFDITDPTGVTQVARYNAIDIAQGVDVAGGYAYVAAGSAGLVVVNVGVPSSPQPGGQIKGTGYARDVLVRGGYAYVADGYGDPTIFVANVTDPSTPTKAGGFQTPGEAYALDMAGSALFVATWDKGLYLLNVGNPAAPALLGSVDTPGRAVDVAVANGFAFVADDWGGWRKINVADPAHPAIVSETLTPGEVRQVAVDADRAVILDNSLGAFTINVADPAQPNIQGRSTGINGAIGNAEDVALSGSHAYVIQSGNIRVLDISTPTAPVLGMLVTTPSTAHSLAVNGGRLFVADGGGGLQIYGLANPAAPALLGLYATVPDEATKVLAAGNTVYLAANGLHVVDVTNPAAPIQLGYYKPAGLIFDMALAGHRLYLNGGFNGIWTVNVSAPATPTEIGHYATILGWPIAATEQGIFVSDERFSPTLQWLDMTNPITPTVLASFPTQVRDMAVADGVLHVAGSWSGLLTFSLPTAVGVGEVRPDQGRAAWANLINIYGSNFQPDAAAQLRSGGDIATPLAVNYLSESHLEAIVPAGLPSGVYGLRITNSDGGAVTLSAAYTVLPADADKLSAYADELWVGPDAARQNRATGVGLVVHRAGGNAARTDVRVDFYVGDHESGGVLLGSAIIASLAPNSYATTPGVAWTPTAQVYVDLYAVINPGSIPISRTVGILPPNVDTDPPVVNTFTTAGGPDFVDPAISLTVGAADAPGGSGVGSIYLMEFDWNANVGTWVKVGDSGWQDYSGNPMILPWNLNWSPGVKNLVVWAGDRAGNVSAQGKVLWINFMPPAMTVNQGMWQMFGYWLDGGQSLSATSTPTVGDPDLYLCCAGGGWIDWSNQTGTVPDSVSMVATSRDRYTLGVYGWTTARYGLNVNRAAVAQLQPASPARDPLGLPALPLGEAPPQALPSAPVGYRVFLPSAMR